MKTIKKQLISVKKHSLRSNLKRLLTIPFFLMGVILFLTSCEIVQETKFNEDGSGTYSLGFDMSEMMKMGANSKKDSTDTKQQIDTVIHFSKFLEEKRDSISKLSKEDQEKIKELENFSLYMKSDTLTNQLVMKIDYDFDNFNDLKDFGKKLEGQKVKELDLFTKQLKGKKNEKDGMQNLNETFNFLFSKTQFSAKITDKALKSAIEKKDTTLTKDNPMSNMIRFKIRYLFPYRIKKVSNKNARILSDFKGIEINANLFETNNNPKYFDLDIEFDN